MNLTFRCSRSQSHHKAAELNELTIFFVVLFFVLAIVTLVGHGIWVLLASVFGQRRSTSTPGPTSGADGRRQCPQCDSPLPPNQQVCPVCDWPHVSRRPADSVAALQAIRRQLEVFGQHGALDAESRAKLTAAINEQEHRLTEAAAAAASRPAAITPAQPAGAPPHSVSMHAPPTGGPTPAAAPTPARSISPGERARNYAASREAARVEALAEPVAPAEQPKRREALSRIFAAFMEEKNIRWGELVGGLLIVGCSIALVISFWSQIAAQPLLKFVLFNGVTAALFGVGMYTDRRWKIHTTSHGLLLIATLLVPLNFLAIAAFTQATPPTDLFSLVGEGVSLGVFALLVYLAGRILVPRDAVLLAGCVMIPCLMQLLIRRFAGEATLLVWLYAMAAAPIAGYLLTTSVVTGRRWTSEGRGAAGADGESGTAEPAVPTAMSMSEVEANRVLTFLGIASTAALMPLALLLHNVPPLGTTLHWLSPLGVLCGMPAVLVGLLFWRRMTDRAFSGLQTIGIGVGARRADDGRRRCARLARSGHAASDRDRRCGRDDRRRDLVRYSGRPRAGGHCPRSRLVDRLLSAARRCGLDNRRLTCTQECCPLGHEWARTRSAGGNTYSARSVVFAIPVGGYRLR